MSLPPRFRYQGCSLCTLASYVGTRRGSTEELTPPRGDPLAAVPVTVAALATLIRPAMWRHFAGGAVGAYSLTPDGWDQLTSAWREAGGVRPGPEEHAAG
jgi:hypothetical protein